jgi:hypothetical protein
VRQRGGHVVRPEEAQRLDGVLGDRPVRVEQQAGIARHGDVADDADVRGLAQVDAEQPAVPFPRPRHIADGDEDDADAILDRAVWSRTGHDLSSTGAGNSVM